MSEDPKIVLKRQEIIDLKNKIKELENRLIKAQVFEWDDLTDDAKKTFEDIENSLKRR